MTQSPLPSWLAPSHYVALGQLLDAFTHLDIPFQATGGLAGNLHGSQWPLHDLDFDVPSSALAQLAEHFRGRILFGPAAYRDEEFALEMLTITIGEVTADLCAAESIRLVTPEGREAPRPSELQRSVARQLGDHVVPTMPLPDLIAYKRVIGRHVDVADLVRLTSPAG